MIEICFKYPDDFLRYKDEHFSLVQTLKHKGKGELSAYTGVAISHRATLKLLLLSEEDKFFFSKRKIASYVENR